MIQLVIKLSEIVLYPTIEAECISSKWNILNLN